MSSLLVILLLNAEINAGKIGRNISTPRADPCSFTTSSYSISSHLRSRLANILAQNQHKKKKSCFFFFSFFSLSINCLFPALICTRGATFSVSYSSANNKKGDKCAPQGRICAFPHGEEERLSLHLRRHHPPIRAGPC